MPKTQPTHFSKPLDRRSFLALLGAGLSTPFTAFGSRAQAGFALEFEYYDFDSDALNMAFNSADRNSLRVFPQSIASGDPSPSGVILWTRIAPSAANRESTVYVQVAHDEGFQNIEFQGAIAPQDIHAARDYTLKIDLDGYLDSDTRYYYRFLCDNTTSRIGRCRTAPSETASPDSLKLAMLSCQDYTNGYYGALSHIARDDNIDFVVHLGDFIYETVGDPRFQNLPFDDRIITLPSEQVITFDLEDYRHLYKTYRSDPHMQRAMEQHTWIITRDDHEVANDCYWDYERDTLGAPDHPFTTLDAFGNDPVLLNQLMLDAQRAWLEHVPARVRVVEDSTHPHQFLQIYRRLVFGDMLDLFMLDTRSYRSPHPCGTGYRDRYLPIGCDAINSGTATIEEQSILGHQQREWLLNGMINSRARWKVLGNQTFMGCMGVNIGDEKIPFNVDAWDGYDAERRWLAEQIYDHRIRDVVVLTGDLHSYTASLLKRDYGNISPFAFDNFVGVEFMTPAVTSANLAEVLTGSQSQNVERDVRWSNLLARITNPHLRYFNSLQHGYSTIRFDRGGCEWECHAVDKSIDSENAAAELLRRFRKYRGWPWLFRRRG